MLAEVPIPAIRCALKFVPRRSPIAGPALFRVALSKYLLVRLPFKSTPLMLRHGVGYTHTTTTLLSLITIEHTYPATPNAVSARDGMTDRPK